MDVTLPTSNAKRPCPSSSSIQNPTIGISDQSRVVDQLLLSFLSMADSPSFPLSLDGSFDRILASHPDRLIDSGLTLGKLLLQSATRCYREHAVAHNPVSWPLSSDLTVKVFSMLDTKSLIYAASTCSMLRKFAMDPMCYSDIDLMDVPIDNEVVYLMIQRAANALRSLRLGVRNCISLCNDESRRKGKGLSCLCLKPLWRIYGAAGLHLRRLHLYNIRLLDYSAFCNLLPSCPNLTDLEIVGLHVGLKQVLTLVTRNCHLIEHLLIEPFESTCNSRYRDDNLESSACAKFVTECANLTSLALRGVALRDANARILVKGFRKLKYLDLSTSYLITGRFLRFLGNSQRGSLLETLVLRDCANLKEVEVARLLSSVLAGDFKFLRHIDISNKDGLASSGGGRIYQPNLCFPLEKLKEERGGIRISADFPSRSSSEDETDSSYDVEYTTSETNSSSSGGSEASHDSSDSLDESSEASDDSLMA